MTHPTHTLFSAYSKYNHDTKQNTRIQEIRCRRCGATDYEAPTHADLPPEILERKFAAKGWSVARRRSRDVCPKCVEEERVQREAKHASAVEAKRRADEALMRASKIAKAEQTIETVLSAVASRKEYNRCASASKVASGDVDNSTRRTYDWIVANLQPGDEVTSADVAGDDSRSRKAAALNRLEKWGVVKPIGRRGRGIVFEFLGKLNGPGKFKRSNPEAYVGRGLGRKHDHYQSRDLPAMPAAASKSEVGEDASVGLTEQVVPEAPLVETPPLEEVDLSTALLDLALKVDALEERYLSTKAECATLREECARLREDNGRLCSEPAKLQVENTALREENDRLRRVIETIREQLAK